MPIAKTEVDRIIGDDSVLVVDGYIYFGVYGQDPKLLANRITLYSDETLSIEIDNPIRTDSFGRPEFEPYTIQDYAYSIYRSDNETLVEGPNNRRIGVDAGTVLSNTVFGVCKTVADMTSASGPLLTNGQRLTAALVAAAANTGALIRTSMNNTTSRLGGADYEIKTLAQHRTDIGDGAWVPDGSLHHYLLGGTTYVAFASVRGYVDVHVMGATPTGDLAEILNNTATNQFYVSGSFLCGTVTRDELHLRLDRSFIEPPTAATPSLFLNIRILAIHVVGYSTIAENTAYTSRVCYVESGNSLDYHFVDGPLHVWGHTATDTIFGCAAGVTSSVGKTTIVFQNGVEVEGFDLSGIDYRCDAMDDESSALVSNVKSHSGSGRCVQFGDNTYGVFQVTVENCPRLGDVSSPGSSEAKGILVYGRNVNIVNNTIHRVKNSAVSGGEGIYIKSAFATITHNKLKNAGSSADGCITLKGASYWNDGYSDEGEHVVVAFNTIEMTDVAYNAKGIGIFDSNVMCVNNTLRDLRPTRSSLTYSEAISIGGSAPVANVTVAGNISVGWFSFSGNFAETTKGRGRYSDNIKIKDNIAIELAGGSFACWDARCLTESRPMTFNAAAKTITIDGGVAQNGEFERFVYPSGSSIVISNTTSNNGTFTVAAVDRYVLTVVEALTDEVATPEIVRASVRSLQITGNTCSGFGTALRNFGSGTAVNQLLVDGNDWSSGEFVYRLDTAGAITNLLIGSQETYENVTDVDFGTPIATNFYRGAKIKSAAAGTMVFEGFNGAVYNVAYT